MSLVGMTAGSAFPNQTALERSFSAQAYKAEWKLVLYTFNK